MSVTPSDNPKRQRERRERRRAPSSATFFVVGLGDRSRGVGVGARARARARGAALFINNQSRSIYTELTTLLCHKQREKLTLLQTVLVGHTEGRELRLEFLAAQTLKLPQALRHRSVGCRRRRRSRSALGAR